MAVPSRNGRHSTDAHDSLPAPDRQPDAPLGSVVIAARDAGTTLPHQLRALADQRPACAWEVIVADNGSTDGTLRLVREARAWFPQVRAVDASAVRGAGAARNAGAASARGELLLFCDADDVVAPGWVEAMRRALDATELVAGRLEWERLNDRTSRRSRALPQTTELQHVEPLPWLTCAAASNLGIRREVFERIGGFDIAARYLQDTDLCWRAQLDGAHLGFAPDAVVHMRLRRGVRGAWRQGRNSGMGQRWLVTRYGALAATRADRPEADAPGAVATRVPGAGAEGVTPGARGAAPPRRGTRSWPRRIVRRGAIVGGEVLRVRSLGDLARLSWNTGFGLGYARGGLPAPDPYPPAHAFHS